MRMLFFEVLITIHLDSMIVSFWRGYSFWVALINTIPLMSPNPITATPNISKQLKNEHERKELIWYSQRANNSYGIRHCILELKFQYFLVTFSFKYCTLAVINVPTFSEIYGESRNCYAEWHEFLIRCFMAVISQELRKHSFSKTTSTLCSSIHSSILLLFAKPHFIIGFYKLP